MKIEQQKFHIDKMLAEVKSENWKIMSSFMSHNKFK